MSILNVMCVHPVEMQGIISFFPYTWTGRTDRAYVTEKGEGASDLRLNTSLSSHQPQRPRNVSFVLFFVRLLSGVAQSPIIQSHSFFLGCYLLFPLVYKVVKSFLSSETTRCFLK